VKDDVKGKGKKQQQQNQAAAAPTEKKKKNKKKKQQQVEVAPQVAAPAVPQHVQLNHHQIQNVPPPPQQQQPPQERCAFFSNISNIETCHKSQPKIFTRQLVILFFWDNFLKCQGWF